MRGVQSCIDRSSRFDSKKTRKNELATGGIRWGEKKPTEPGNAENLTQDSFYIVTDALLKKRDIRYQN